MGNHSRMLGCFLLLSMMCCKEKTAKPSGQQEAAIETNAKKVAAISFGGKELYQREVDASKHAKYTKRIDSVRAIATLTQLDYEVLGGYHSELFQYHKAIAVYIEGLEHFPDSYRLLRHRGHRYINLRNLEQAIIDL